MSLFANVSSVGVPQGYGKGPSSFSFDVPVVGSSFQQPAIQEEQFSDFPITQDPRALIEGPDEKRLIFNVTSSPLLATSLSAADILTVPNPETEALVREPEVIAETEQPSFSEPEAPIVAIDDPAIEADSEKEAARSIYNLFAGLSNMYYTQPFDTLPDYAQEAILDGIANLYYEFLEEQKATEQRLGFSSYYLDKVLQNADPKQLGWVKDVYNAYLQTVYERALAIERYVERRKRNVDADVERFAESLSGETYETISTFARIINLPWYFSAPVGIALFVLPLFLWNAVRSYVSAGPLDETKLASRLVRDITNLYQGSLTYAFLSKSDQNLLRDVGVAVAKFARKNPSATDEQFVNAMITLYGPRFNRYLELIPLFIKPARAAQQQPVIQGFGRSSCVASSPHKTKSKKQMIVVGVVRVRERRFI